MGGRACLPGNSTLFHAKFLITGLVDRAMTRPGSAPVAGTFCMAYGVRNMMCTRRSGHRGQRPPSCCGCRRGPLATTEHRRCSMMLVGWVGGRVWTYPRERGIATVVAAIRERFGVVGEAAGSILVTRGHHRGTGRTLRPHRTASRSKHCAAVCRSFRLGIVFSVGGRLGWVTSNAARRDRGGDRCCRADRRRRPSRW